MRDLLRSMVAASLAAVVVLSAAGGEAEKYTLRYKFHPGEILREDYLSPLGMSVNSLAKALSVTPARINDIIRERRGISADTALRLARYFGTDARSWMNLQSAYDLYEAREAFKHAA